MNAELPPSTNAPVTEAELQAFVDGQLPPARKLDIESYLATRPAAPLRLEAYRAEKRGRHAMFDPVVNEPLPQRLPDLASPLKPLGTCNAWSPGWPLRSSVARRGGDCAAVCRRLAQATQRSWLR